MVREIKDKIRKLNLDTEGIRVYANGCSYDKATALRDVKAENEKKLNFYKGLLNAMTKGENDGIKK